MASTLITFTHPRPEDVAHYRRPLEPQMHIDHRPWGRFDLLVLNEQVSVKILTVNPGARLSMQRHEMRDEWWHIMGDGLVVEIDGVERRVKPGDRVWIPRGAVHRVRNTEDSVALFVELAFGHFDEDDIERLEDDYARVGRAVDEHPGPAPSGTVSSHFDTSAEVICNARLRFEDNTAGHDLTILIPTINEGANIRPLVDRLTKALRGRSAEILFVDDSSDDTPEKIRLVAADSALPVRMIHRRGEERVGGLAGAVAGGIRASTSEFVLVMDGDLQHPPETAVKLRDAMDGFDLSVASRHVGAGNSLGLSNSYRRLVSSGSTIFAQACFPRRVGKVCTDPMTGFFCFRRSAVDVSLLRPRGFKILLEILARHDLRVTEIPFTFGERLAGDSKASWRNGLHFLHQLLSLRMGRMSRFAAVGLLGTLVNLLVMGVVVSTGVHYVLAAIVAAEVSILHNFLLQERFVFRDMRIGAHSWPSRVLQSLIFNNAEAVLRLPFLVLLVETMQLWALLAQGLTLTVAFVARFLFVSRVVYRPKTLKRLTLTRTTRAAAPGEEQVAA